MKLLPKDRLCIITSLSPAEVQKQMQLNVSPKPEWSFESLFADTGNKYFTGTVENARFEIIRIIQGRNSFLPVIKGHTEPWLNGSRIYINMRLQLFVAVFMCFWLGGVGLGGVGLLISGLMSGQFSPAMLIPFGMFALGYAMMIGFYSFERNKAKELLLQIVDGQIDDTAFYYDRKTLTK
ncbi:hypothetical protein KHS38_15100 [Mucilaginibacter sp. Bleaf8]|uniref:hypothetical protein n=1 Tax=Mucilaginibacter sp. Bleaf8 TaxID=2834430 RepID=UPI001BD11B88|nr:hypothetical protein [Mucilaginibacter sp. Bleaf8]MBS7565734.1 hypothetical protein [Mucilaginibacter sp. Bleaf8]